MPEPAWRADALRLALRPADGEAWAALAGATEGEARLRLLDEAALRGTAVRAEGPHGAGPLARCHAAVAAAEAEADRASEAYRVLEQHREALPLVSLCLLEHRLAMAAGDGELALRVRERALTRPVEDDPPALLSSAWTGLTESLAEAWRPEEPREATQWSTYRWWRRYEDAPMPPEVDWPGNDALRADKLAALRRVREEVDAQRLTFFEIDEDGERVAPYWQTLWACRPSSAEGDLPAQWLGLMEVIAGAETDVVRAIGVEAFDGLVAAARHGELGLDPAGIPPNLVHQHLALAFRLDDPEERMIRVLNTVDAYTDGRAAGPVVEAALALLRGEHDPVAWAAFPWKGAPFAFLLDPRHPLKPWLLPEVLPVYWQSGDPSVPWLGGAEPTREEGLQRLRAALDAIVARPKPLYYTGLPDSIHLPPPIQIALLDQAPGVLLADTEERGRAEIARRYREDATQALWAWAQGLERT